MNQKKIIQPKRKNKIIRILLILLVICLINLGIINVFIVISVINNKNVDLNKTVDEAVQEAIDKYIYDKNDGMSAINIIDGSNYDFLEEELITEITEITEKSGTESMTDNTEETTNEISDEIENQYMEIDEIIFDDLFYVDSPYYEPDIPFLFNRNNYIPDDYNLDLVYVDSTNTHIIHKKAWRALTDMLAASKKDGISLWIVSAYRSHERQTNNFNNNMNILISRGLGRDEAYLETARYIAVPGTSEHEAGLAIDFNVINGNFDQTREYMWLINNCTDYGFILRYQKDTEYITNIAYEPWHYRYVGINHAKKIVELDITLDEYVSSLKKFE